MRSSSFIGDGAVTVMPPVSGTWPGGGTKTGTGAGRLSPVGRLDSATAERGRRGSAFSPDPGGRGRCQRERRPPMSTPARGSTAGAARMPLPEMLAVGVLPTRWMAKMVPSDRPIWGRERLVQGLHWERWHRYGTDDARVACGA